MTEVDTKQGVPGQGAGSIPPLRSDPEVCLSEIHFHALLQTVLCSSLTAVSQKGESPS